MKFVKNNPILIVFAIIITFVLWQFVIADNVLPEDKFYDETVTEYTGEWERVLADGSTVKQEVPGKCNAKRGEEIVVRTTLPSDIYEDTYLCFRSGKQDMEFYVDDELHMEYNTKTTRFTGKYSPVAFVFVKIGPRDAGKILTVKSQTGSSYSGIFYNVYRGEMMAIWKYFFEQFGSETVIAFALFVLSLFCIIGGWILLLFYRTRTILTHISWGIFLASIWIIVNSVFRQLIYNNMSVVNDMAFYMIMLMPVPFLMYIDEIQNKRYAHIYRALEIIAETDFVICTVLHLTKIVDFAESVSVMVIISITVVLMMGVMIIVDLIRGYIKEYYLVAIGMLCVYAAAIFQMVTYFQKTKFFSGATLAMGLLLLLAFAIADSIKKLVNIEAEKQHALAASEEKTKFLAKMSHEIRTPINALIGFDTMILRETREESTREYANDIYKSSMLLLDLVNEILDLSRIESGKVEIISEEYDYSKMIHEIISMISVKAESKGLEFNINLDESIPLGLIGDCVRIKQILTNILTNAVKYTEEGSITLTVSANYTEDEKKVIMHFSVKDTGIGIKDEDIKKLFIPFERIEEKRNHNIEGTGLGMAITMQLLELMNSRLIVDSVYGQGSEFSFDIEQGVYDNEPVGSLCERISVSNNNVYREVFTAPDAHVLVVDDNVINLRVFESLLRKTGMQIDKADNGITAIEMIKNNRYDVIFLDHMMPDMDGIEVLDNVRKLSDYPNKDTPFVALTANAISGAKEMYLENGFDDFLAKPIIPAELENMLAAILPNDKYYRTLQNV